MPAYYGPRSWWLLIFLVIVALAAWIYGQFVQRGGTRRWLGLATALILLVAGYGYAIEGELQWRFPVPAGVAQGSLKTGPQGIDWQRWSLAAVTEARAEGHPVLVDFTADWCLTCQANKSIRPRSRLGAREAAPGPGDRTLGATTRGFQLNITEELNRYGRAGVPLVLVYPKEPRAPAIVSALGAHPRCCPSRLGPGGEVGPAG